MLNRMKWLCGGVWFLCLCLLTAPVTAAVTPKISAGAYHSAALMSDGSVMTWGYNNNGQLGNGTTVDSSTPVKVTGLGGTVTSISAGAFHTVALMSDGTVKAWGNNSYGQLGNGATANSNTPVTVTGLGGTVTAIAAGAYYTVALMSDGSVKTWGFNQDGYLGNGTTTDSSTPVTVTGLGGAVTAIAASWHTVALMSDGTVKTWGLNGGGALGNGNASVASSSTPVTMLGVGGGGTSVISIAAGDQNTYALMSDGTVKACGANGNGQLGNGTLMNSATAQTIPGLTGVVAISGGGFSALALMNDGTIKTWGYQYLSGTNLLTPTTVDGLSEVTAISSGEYFNIALMSNDTVKAWGENLQGELGNGTTINSAPVTVSGLNLLVTPNPQYIQLTNQATGVDRNPAWSPDGTKIAFHSTRNGNNQIYVMSADGSNLTQLTPNSNQNWNISPNWSPDGRSIIFESYRTGKAQIWTMNADGTNSQQLTNNSAVNEQPTFSPDGTKVAFTSSLNGNSDIWLMNLDGSNLKALTTNSSEERSPAFSPDGAKIAYQSNATGATQIWVMNSDGSNQTQVTTSGGVLPTWSPDGTRIAYQSTGVNKIWAVNVDGTNNSQIIDDSGSDNYPSWSPDGAKIAFSSNITGHTDLWLYQFGPVPTISGTPITSATVGLAYTFMPTSTNAANFSYTGTLPAGLSFNSSTGAITGAPISAGTYSNIIIIATNFSGSVSLPAFAITVTAPVSPVTGSCGPSNGVSFFVTPAKNLCTSGNASTVSGSGPWNWNCSGSNGGTTAYCSASKTASPTTPITTTTRPTVDFSGFKTGSTFAIYRSEGGKVATAIYSGPQTSFSDSSSLKPNTIYQYTVTSDTDPAQTVIMTIRTPLYNGWNIVAVPYDTTGASANSFFASPVSSVYQWIPTGATPEASDSVLGSYSTINALVPGTGYFVKATNSGTLLTYTGNPGPASATIILKPGWTMIANPNTTNKTSIGANWLLDGAPLSQAITGDKIGGGIYWWNGTTYDSWSIMNDNPQIEPWKGYWIVNIDSANHTLTIQ